MSGKKVEGYWDCTYCDTKGIGGLTKVCPNCGNPQAKNLKFYLKPGAKKYLAPEIADNYGKGADWVCAFCGSFNRYNATICENCGAGKADSEEDYFGKKLILLQVKITYRSIMKQLINHIHLLMNRKIKVTKKEYMKKLITILL